MCVCGGGNCVCVVGESVCVRERESVCACKSERVRWLRVAKFKEIITN